MVAGMPNTTTEDGWTTKYITRREKLAEGMTWQIQKMLKDIRIGDYKPVDPKVMMDLAKSANALAVEVQSRFAGRRT